jgi:hypothetical protein
MEERWPSFLREPTEADRAPVTDCNPERVFIYVHILVFADTVLSVGSAPRNVNVEEHYVFRWQNNSISGLDITVIRAEISAQQRGEGSRMLSV